MDGIVIHTTVGYYEGTVNYFKNNDRQVSAHFVVSLNGDVTQMVAEDRAAHHAGIVSNPVAKFYKKGVNPNLHTIGIENADDNKPHEADRSRQLPALAELVYKQCVTHNLPIDSDHIAGHRDIYSKKTCPGNIDVSQVIAMAKRIQDEKSGTISPPMSDVLDDAKRALNELEGYKNKNNHTSLEGAARAAIGLAGDASHLQKENVEIKTALRDRDIFIAGQKETIRVLAEQNEAIASKLGTANDHSKIMGEIRRLIGVEDEKVIADAKLANLTQALSDREQNLTACTNAVVDLQTQLGEALKNGGVPPATPSVPPREFNLRIWFLKLLAKLKSKR